MRKLPLLAGLAAVSAFGAPAKEYTELLPTLKDKLDTIKAVVADGKQVQYNDFDESNNLRSFAIVSYNPKTNVLEMMGRKGNLNYGTVQDFNADGLVSKEDIYMGVLDGTGKYTKEGIQTQPELRLWVKGPAEEWDLDPALESKLTWDYAHLVNMTYDFVMKNKE